jgi:hypothetical protein
MMNRNGLSIRRKTHEATALSEEEIGSIHLDFVVHIRDTMELHSLLPKRVINMDETGCHFDMAPSTTVEVKNTKHVSIRGTGSTQCCTVFLAVALNGDKLKPLIVFKAKPGKTVEKNLHKETDPRTITCVQENAYCDERVMLIWVIINLIIDRTCIKTIYSKQRKNDYASNVR